MNINLAKPDDVLRLVFLLLSPQIIISSLEGLYNRSIYQTGQLLNWPYIRLSKKIFYSTPAGKKISALLFTYPNFLFVLITRLALTVFLVACTVLDKDCRMGIIALALLTIIVGLRDTYSNNGADQLSGIILIALSLAAIRDSGIVKMAAIFFIAFQSLLSYFTSGIYKLINEGWRNGSSLRGVLSTEVFGSRHVKKIMDNLPNSYVLGSFAIIFGEIFLGLSFLMPAPLCLLVLATGILFHLSVAVLMGLNTFVWVFASTYPAIYFVSLYFFTSALK